MIGNTQYQEAGESSSTAQWCISQSLINPSSQQLGLRNLAPRHVTPLALISAYRALAPVACLTHAVRGPAPRAAPQRPDPPLLPAAALFAPVVSANPPATSHSLESENNSVAPRPQNIGEPSQQELKGTEFVEIQRRVQHLCRSHPKLQPRAPSLHRMYPILG